MFRLKYDEDPATSTVNRLSLSTEETWSKEVGQDFQENKRSPQVNSIFQKQRGITESLHTLHLATSEIGLFEVERNGMMSNAEGSTLGIVIRSAASGAELVKLAADDLPVLAETERISVLALKRVLAKRINLSRLRQRLLTDGGELLHDDTQLSPPVNLQLVKLELLKPDEKRDFDFVKACDLNRVREVETMLHGPQDPNTVHDDGPPYIIPLHVTCQEGSLKVVKLLLEAGADTELCGRDGSTALHFAAQAGQSEVVQLLLKSGANTDVLDHQQSTPLLFAAEHGHLEVVRLLLKSRADKDKFDRQGRTPLLFATYSGHLKVVQLLLEADADKEMSDRHGTTPLLLAAYVGHLEQVRMLLEAGADKETSDHDGATPLLLAVEQGHLEVVRVLLEAGADRDKRLGDGRTPLELALEQDLSEIIDLLSSFPAVKRQRR